MSGLPQGWKEITLSELGSFSKGKGISKNEVIDTGYPCIRYAEIYTEHDYVIKEFKSFINEESAKNSTELKQNDILFAGSGETAEDIGKSVAFVSEVKAFVGGDTVVFTPKENILDSIFMAYQLNNNEVRKQLLKLAQGHSVVHIYSKSLMNIKVNFPPLEEQKKIADILSTVDQKIDLIDTQINDTGVLKKGLMQKLLTQGIGHSEFKESEIGRIPVGWEVVEQSEVSTFYNGRAYKLSEWEDKGTLVIRLQNLTGSGKDYYYSTMNLPDNQYCNYGDLLYMWSATFGPVWWKGEKAIYHYHIWKIATVETKLDKNFLFYLLDQITMRMKKQSHGSTMIHVTKGGMEKLKIQLPPLEEQKQIAQILSTTDEKLYSLQEKKEAYETLKKGLMQKLLTGEVRV